MSQPGGPEEIDLGDLSLGAPSGAEEVDTWDLALDPPSVEEGPAKPVEKTRALLAYLMLGLLSVVIVAMLGMLCANRLTASEFSSVGGVLISPIVGLLGAATGYYYGRGDK